MQKVRATIKVFGVIADRPAAAAAYTGWTWIATDEDYKHYDCDGVAWQVDASGGGGPVAAADVSVDSTSLVGVGTNAQAVFEELDNGIADHLADATDAHAGTAITNTPAGSVAATTVQAAINELDTEKAAAAHVHSGADITSGTVADARIDAAIARDSEVTAAVAAEASARDTAIGVETSARAAADALLVPKTLADANSVLYAVTDDTPAALAMGASTILARLAAGNIVAATPAELRTLLGLVIGTNVQAYDADLTTYAGINPSSNVQSVLAAADYAAIRTLLGTISHGVLFDSTLGADTASIDTGATLGAGYNVLEVWAVVRTDDAAAAGLLQILFNGDTGANYTHQRGSFVSTTAASAQTLAANNLQLTVHGSGGSASYATIVRFDIPSYAQTTFFKTFVIEASHDDATAGNNRHQTAVATWASTAAINQIKIQATGAQKLKTGSRLLVIGR